MFVNVGLDGWMGWIGWIGLKVGWVDGLMDGYDRVIDGLI